MDKMKNKECKFCGKEHSNLITHVEGGVKYDVCPNCFDAIIGHRCIQCGKPLDEGAAYFGRCISPCAQIYAFNEARDSYEKALGVKFDEPALYPSDNGEPVLRFTQQDYEKWLTFDPDNRGFNTDNFKESHFLRRLWIMLKLTAAGYTDEKTINDNMSDIEELLDSNITKIIGKKCRFSIFTPNDNRRLQGNTVLAHKGRVYLYLDN